MKKKASAGGGNWSGFLRMLGQIDLPWGMIAVAFIVELGYNHILLSLPTTTAALMSGSLEDKALLDALLYYISYGVAVTLDLFVLGFVCRLAVRNARTRIWGGMTRVRMDYYDSHTPTALSSAVTNDLEESVRLLVSLMISILPSLYYLVAAILTIGKYDFLLVLSILIPLPLRYLEMVFVGRWIYRAQAGIFQRIGALTGYLAERIKNLPLIKNYCTEEQELQNGQTASKDLFKANMQAVKVEGAAMGINQAITVIQQIVIVLFGLLLLKKGRIDHSQWIAFFLFSTTISTRFVEFVQNWQSLKSIQGQVARVVEVVEAPKEQTQQEAKAAGQAMTVSGQSPAVKFDNVSFAYGDKPALNNVSFTVPAGTATAIVGLCGSGKTTLLNLLERFYEAGDGNIALDGESIAAMSLEELRGRFSYVQQDAGVFSGKVREVLTYGIHRQLTDDELIQAAKDAGAWDFIQTLPGDLDAEIAADGQSLSGGQRQRLVLAREFLRNADVLLLDEPTSALDATTAQAVEETVFRLFRGKTILMVTHDMSLVSGMDQIVVLQDGDLVGRGTYDELKGSCPLFREMVAAQRREEACV